MARLAQLVERKALNLVVVGSSPTVGVYFQRSEVSQCGVFWAYDPDGKQSPRRYLCIWALPELG